MAVFLGASVSGKIGFQWVSSCSWIILAVYRGGGKPCVPETPLKSVWRHIYGVEKRLHGWDKSVPIGRWCIYWIFYYRQSEMPQPISGRVIRRLWIWHSHHSEWDISSQLILTICFDWALEKRNWAAEVGVIGVMKWTMIGNIWIETAMSFGIAFSTLSGLPLRMISMIKEESSEGPSFIQITLIYDVSTHDIP